MKYTGLFFGSFNPIHNGHLAIARYLLDNAYCKDIWFVISPQNPWKEDRELLPEQQRLEIVETAISRDIQMSACDIEFTMPRPSYTYHTLQVLTRRYPEEHFALIIGADNLERFHLWKNSTDILRQYPVFVYPRPGNQARTDNPQIVPLPTAPLMSVSSSEIRQKVKEGLDISGNVPEEIIPLVKKYYAPVTP